MPVHHYYEGRTIRGLGWVRWSLWVFFGFAVISLLISVLIAVYLLPTLLSNPASILGEAFGVLAAACGLIIVGVVGLVFFLVGFGHVYGGRREYGARHTKYMEQSLILLILTVVAYLAQSAVPSGALGTLISAAGSTTEIDLVVTAVLRIVVAALAGLTLLFPVYALADPAQARRLVVAAILGVVSAAAMSAIVVMGVYTQPPSGYATVIISSALAGSGVGVISLLLFLVVYQQIEQRLRSGAIPPALPLPPPMPYAYPSYPYLWTMPPVAPPPPPQRPEKPPGSA